MTKQSGNRNSNKVLKMETSEKSSVTRCERHITKSTHVQTTNNVMWSSAKKVTVNSRTAKRSKSVRFSERNEFRDSINDENGDEFLHSIYGPKKIEHPKRLRKIELQDYGDKIKLTNERITEMCSNAIGKRKKSNEMVHESVTVPNDQNAVAKQSKSDKIRGELNRMNNIDDFDKLLQNSKCFQQLTENVTKLMEMQQMFMTKQAQIEQNMTKMLDELGMGKHKRQLEPGQSKIQLELEGPSKSKRRKSDLSFGDQNMSSSTVNRSSFEISTSIQEERITRNRVRRSTVNEQTINQESNTIEPPPEVHQSEHSKESVECKLTSHEIPIKSKRIERDRLKRSQTIDERKVIQMQCAVVGSTSTPKIVIRKIKNRRNTHAIVSTTNESNVYKNTNKSLHFNNPETKTCVLCQKYYEKIVSHYKKSHCDHEVFVSRLSSTMAAELMRERPKSSSKMIGYNNLVEAKCHFCENDKAFSLSYWFSHIQSHTGEYAYICRSCNATSPFRNNHCGVKMVQITDQDENQRDITAFLCLDCNFIQMHESNMHQHLESQHEFSRDSFNGKYTTITLLSGISNETVPKPIIKRMQALKKAVENSALYIEGNFCCCFC